MRLTKPAADAFHSKSPLGVLVVGMGAVSTSFVAGVLAVRRGLGRPFGSLTQMGVLRDNGYLTDVRTAAGQAVVSVPAGTRAGRRLRLRGQGLSDGRGGRGDVILVVRLVLPPDLTQRQRELILEAGRETARRPS